MLMLLLFIHIPRNGWKNMKLKPSFSYMHPWGSCTFFLWLFWLFFNFNPYFMFFLEVQNNALLMMHSWLLRMQSTFAHSCRQLSTPPPPPCLSTTVVYELQFFAFLAVLRQRGWAKSQCTPFILFCMSNIARRAFFKKNWILWWFCFRCQFFVVISHLDLKWAN